MLNEIQFDKSSFKLSSNAVQSFLNVENYGKITYIT